MICMTSRTSDRHDWPHDDAYGSCRSRSPASGQIRHACAGPAGSGGTRADRDREELMAIIKDIDEREMPLLDHLVELRNRLMYSAAAIILGFLRLLRLRRRHLRLPGAPARPDLRGHGHHRPPDDLHRPDRSVLHLHQGRVLGRRLHHLPVRRDPALAVHRPRPVPEREGGLPAVPGRDAGPVLHRRRVRLLLHLPAGLAVLPELRDRPSAGRASCRSSSRRASASISTW